jgi:hypothetical protein
MYFWKKETPQLTPASRVIINIWLPKINGRGSTTTEFIKALQNNQTDPCTSRIGHVSLETPNKYASWWPDPRNDEQVGVFNVVGAQNSDYATDCSSEGGQPDLRICLYSLKIGDIEDCFANIENDPSYGYVLAGDKIVTRLFNNEKGQSCCGLAYEILAAGGLLKLGSIHMDLKSKWVIVTPANFAELVKNSKQKEWGIYPETQSFSQIPNEYIPHPALQSNLCSIV